MSAEDYERRFTLAIILAMYVHVFKDNLLLATIFISLSSIYPFIIALAGEDGG